MVNAPRQTIHLIRHAEALHNVADDWALPDPPLTDRGFAQARGMPREYAQLMDSCDLIVASPLRRTLQTTLFGLEPCIRRGVPVILLGELQECGANPCDTGSSLDVLRSEFGQHQAFSFHTVDEGWTSKRGKWSPSDAALAKRARWVRRWLKARPEANIAVVTHGSFLRQITYLPWSDRWANAERRAFRFVCDGPLSQGKVDEGDDAVLDYVERDAGLSYENGNDEAPDDHNGSR